MLFCAAGSHPSRRFNTITGSSQPGRSGEAGSAGIAARPLWISSPATCCSSRRFRGTNGLPSNKNNKIPNTGKNTINSSHAIAEDGRRRSGTNPNAIRLITKLTPKMPTATNSVSVTDSTRREPLPPTRAPVPSSGPNTTKCGTDDTFIRHVGVTVTTDAIPRLTHVG